MSSETTWAEQRLRLLYLADGTRSAVLAEADRECIREALRRAEAPSLEQPPQPVGAHVYAAFDNGRARCSCGWKSMQRRQNTVADCWLDWRAHAITDCGMQVPYDPSLGRAVTRPAAAPSADASHRGVPDTIAVISEAIELIDAIAKLGRLRDGGEQFPNWACCVFTADRLREVVASAKQAHPAPAEATERVKCVKWGYEGDCCPGGCQLRPAASSRQAPSTPPLDTPVQFVAEDEAIEQLAAACEKLLTARKECTK